MDTRFGGRFSALRRSIAQFPVEEPPLLAPLVPRWSYGAVLCAAATGRSPVTTQFFLSPHSSFYHHTILLRQTKTRPAASLQTGAQLFQASRGFVQCLRLFAERKTHLLGAVFWLFVETRSRHAGNSNFPHQMRRELDVIGEPERADVGHHVIGAPRPIADEPGFLERRNQMIDRKS